MPDPKHLEFLQAIISRMASNSASLKTWAVTLTAALFALAAKDANARYVLVALLPIVVFWCLDAYYLRQERCFRALYARAIDMSQPPLPPFSLDTKDVCARVESAFRVGLSRTISTFYGGISIAIMITAWISSVWT